jgi:ATP-dependent Clp protease ATP-binding subunit ClpA
MSTRMPTRSRVTMRTHHVFADAHDLADMARQEDVTPLHVFLAILWEGHSPAVAVLHNLEVPLDRLTSDLEKQLPHPLESSAAGSERSWSTSDEIILQRAGVEASALGHPYIGCEHLLLAFLRDQESTLSQLLARHGVRFVDAHTEVVRLLGRPADTGNSPAV